MTSRPYAQIECSLTNSKKLRGLSSHSGRWAYLCAHLSDYCTYSGLFRYPSVIWAHDAQIDPDSLSSVVSELVEAGLIEYDPDEEFVRIVGWHHKRSGPDNPNRVDSIIADLSSLSAINDEMFCASVSELAAASVKRSLRWLGNTGSRDQLYGSLRVFLAEAYQDYGDALIASLNAELEASPASVGKEIGAIFPALMLTNKEPLDNPSGRVPPTLAEHEMRRDVDEMKMKREEDENETVQISALRPSSGSAPETVSELLRKGSKPKASTINSPLAQAARGVK